MVQKPYDVVLDLYQTGTKTTQITYTALDNETMPLTIELQNSLENGVFFIPQSATVLLHFMCSNGVGFSRMAQIVDAQRGKICYVLTSDDVLQSGVLLVCVTVTEGKKRLSFQPMQIYVTKALCDEQRKPPDILLPWKNQITDKLADHEVRIGVLEKSSGGIGAEVDPVYKAEKAQLAFKTDLPHKLSELENDAYFVNQTQLKETIEGIYNKIQIYIPPSFSIAVNEPFELYFNTLTANDEGIFNTTVSCTKGRCFEDKWSFTPIASDVGSYALVITIKRNGVTVFEGDTTIHVVTRATVPALQKMLFIGDSITLGMQHGMKYMEDSSVRDYGTNRFVFVGTQGSAPYQHEGRNGWSTKDYTTNRVGNPFWSFELGKLSFTHYTTNTGIMPDVVHIMLGANDVWSIIGEDVSFYVTNLTTMVNQIRLDWPNAKILLSPTPQWGSKNGFGYTKGSAQLKAKLDKQIFLLAQGMYGAFSAVDNVFLTSVYWGFDSQNNYPLIDVPVNPFNTYKMSVQNDIVHPSDAGNKQIGSSIYSAWNNGPIREQEGITFINMVEDPVYAYPQVKWTYTGSKMDIMVSDGILTFTGKVGATANVVNYINLITFVPGHKYYVRVMMKTNDATHANFSARYVTMGAGVSAGWTSEKTTQWLTLSDVMTGTLNSFIPTFFYNATIGIEGKTYQFQKPMVIDLSTPEAIAAGLDKKTKTWLDANIEWFVGSKTMYF